MRTPFDGGHPVNESLRKSLRDWWEGLEDNKGERAELCRCATLTEVLLCPAFYSIACPLETAGIPVAKRASVAAIVGLLASVRHDSPSSSFPAAMAKGEAKPTVSPARFRRLLEAQTVDDLYPLLRRVLGLVDKTANIMDLANSIYDWDNETRKRWAYAYFVNVPKKAAGS